MADSPATPEFPLHVLSEYALLADGERGILVGPRGDFVWMCAPRWDSDALFSALIGGAGVYAVTPVEQPFVWGGYYEPGSLIWRSRWITTTQAIECREALAMPGDRHTAVALRRVEAIDGDTRVRVVFDPRAGFGRHQLSQVTQAGGVWTARSGPLYLRWSGMRGARHRADGSLRAEVTVPAGDHLDLVLEVSDRPLAGPPPDSAAAWSATRAAWDEEVPALSGTIADRDARQAYAVLRGLTSAGGGMAAAATTSLPDAWSTLADTIIADAAADCLHPTGRWQRAPDDPRIDARTTPVPPRSPTPRASRKSATATEDVRHNCCDGLPPEAKGLGATVVGLRVVP